MAVIRQFGWNEDVSICCYEEGYEVYISMFARRKHENPENNSFAMAKTSYSGKTISTGNIDEVLEFLDQAASSGHKFTKVSREELEGAR